LLDDWVMTRGKTTALFVCLAVALGLTAPAANAAIGSYAGSIELTNGSPYFFPSAPGPLSVNSLTGDIYVAHYSGGYYSHLDSSGSLLATVYGDSAGIPDNRDCSGFYGNKDLNPLSLMANPLTGGLYINSIPRLNMPGSNDCDSPVRTVYNFDSSDTYTSALDELYTVPPDFAHDTYIYSVTLPVDIAHDPTSGRFYSLWVSMGGSTTSPPQCQEPGICDVEVVISDNNGNRLSSFHPEEKERFTNIVVNSVSGDIYLGGTQFTEEPSGYYSTTVKVTRFAFSAGTWTPTPYEVSTEGLPEPFNPSLQCYRYGYSLTGLAVDGPNNRLYAAADNNCRNSQNEPISNSVGAVLQWEDDQPVGVLNGNLTNPGSWRGSSFNGIAVNQMTGMIYVSDAGNNVVSYFDADVVPEADSGSATPTDPFTETVIGSVNPSGEPLTSCYVQYGTTTAYGQVELCRQAPEDFGDGTEPVTASAVLSNLTPNTTYHYRIVAGNSNGSQAGFDVSFVSEGPDAPEIVGSPSANASTSPVTLGGIINPHYGNTSYYFVYGLSTSYGQQTTTQQVPVSDNNAQAVSAQLPANLVAGATYHVALVAQNSAGSASSGDFTFVAPLNAPVIYQAGLSSFVPVGQTSVQFEGAVSPGGGSAACEFEIVSDAGYQPGGDPYALGTAFSCSPSTVSGNSYTFVYGGASGLQPNTLYHAHMTLEGAGGSDDSGDFTFQTNPRPPAISGVAATSIGTTTATLQAQLVRNSEPVNYYFQYGVSLAYGLKSPTVTATSDGLVSFNVTGLAPGTEYHGSLVAVGRTGATTLSEDVAFTTAASTPVIQPPASVAPEVFFYSGPRSGTVDQQATFVFSGSASVSRYECRIDAGTWLPCTNGFNTSVVPGDHMFELRGLTASGASSNVFTYYWTVNLPQRCVVKTARAHLLLNTSNRQAGLTMKYKTYSPTKNVTGIFYAKMKGGKNISLGKSTANFKTAGTFKVVKAIDKATWKKVKKAKSFAVQLKVPHVQASCNQYLTKALTIKKRFSAAVRGWFQSDALFSTKPLTR
jgi:hypothetical protein